MQAFLAPGEKCIASKSNQSSASDQSDNKCGYAAPSSSRKKETPLVYLWRHGAPTKYNNTIMDYLNKRQNLSPEI